MKQKLVLFLTLFVVMTMTTGCLSRAIKEGMGAATGASGVYRVVESPGRQHSALVSYGTFEVEPFADGFNGKIPSALLKPIQPNIKRQLVENKAIPKGASGKTLLIKGKVIYYETANMMGQVFGPFEEAIAEVAIYDKSSGEKLGEAICIGRSNATTAQGLDKKADGIAKAVVDFLADYYPKPKKDD